MVLGMLMRVLFGQFGGEEMMVMIIDDVDGTICYQLFYVIASKHTCRFCRFGFLVFVRSRAAFKKKIKREKQ